MPTNQWAFMGRIKSIDAKDGNGGGVFYKVTIHAASTGERSYPATVVCKLGKGIATPPPAEGTPVVASGMFGHYEGKDGRYFSEMVATELRVLAEPRGPASTNRPPPGAPYHVSDADVPSDTKQSSTKRPHANWPNPSVPEQSTPKKVDDDIPF